MHGEERNKFAAMLNRYAQSDPDLIRQFKRVVDEWEQPMPYSDGALHNYALAERRVRDYTHPDLAAVASEWEIEAEFATSGPKAIDDAMRLLRNAALSVTDQTYIPSLIAGAIRNSRLPDR